jgi:hypothetical protein
MSEVSVEKDESREWIFQSLPKDEHPTALDWEIREGDFEKFDGN